MKKLLLAIPFCLAVANCSDSDDPSVADMSSLAPPTGLISVTGDTQVELRWMGTNYEEDFSGYHVFQATKSISSLKSASAPASPKGVDISKNQGVPRCAANNTFFSEFGVTSPSQSQCDDGDVELKDDADTLVGIQKAKVLCYDPATPATALGTADTSSLDKGTADGNDGVGVQRCLIKGLTNGTTYSFIVVSVTGDSYDEISWTSNVAEDTPATKIFSGKVTIPASKYATITLGATAATAATLTDGTSATTCTSAICGLVGTNTATAAAIHLGRDSVSSVYNQRVFVSTGSASAVEIAYRGPLTLDPVQGESVIATSIPGDKAIASSTTDPYNKGAKFVVYDNMVYDIEYTISGAVHYGKLIIGNLEYAGNVKTADVSFTATVLMQSQAGQVHYIRHGLPIGASAGF